MQQLSKPDIHGGLGFRKKPAPLLGGDQTLCMLKLELTEKQQQQ